MDKRFTIRGCDRGRPVSVPRQDKDDDASAVKKFGQRTISIEFVLDRQEYTAVERKAEYEDGKEEWV